MSQSTLAEPEVQSLFETPELQQEQVGSLEEAYFLDEEIQEISKQIKALDELKKLKKERYDEICSDKLGELDVLDDGAFKVEAKRKEIREIVPELFEQYFSGYEDQVRKVTYSVTAAEKAGIKPEALRIACTVKVSTTYKVTPNLRRGRS